MPPPKHRGRLPRFGSDRYKAGLVRSALPGPGDWIRHDYQVPFVLYAASAPCDTGKFENAVAIRCGHSNSDCSPVPAVSPRLAQVYINSSLRPLENVFPLPLLQLYLSNSTSRSLLILSFISHWLGCFHSLPTLLGN